MGDNPPYHVPVFVLTPTIHAPRSTPNGGTTFHFVTNGPEAALERATQAAGGLDIRLRRRRETTIQRDICKRRARRRDAGGDRAGVPLGAGESLFAGLDLPSLGYRCTERVAGAQATHFVVTRSR